jgi:cytochrome subunit of sulfide dehydrogenase
MVFPIAAFRRPRVALRVAASRPAHSNDARQETTTMHKDSTQGRLRLAALIMLALPLPLPLLAQDANQARSLAATCANCHGTNGQAKGDMKPLAGLAADRIVAQLADYKSGAQPATIMHQIAKGYSDAQIKLIADYFASQRQATK